MKVQFEIAPHELLPKDNDRISVLHNNVALALANLQGAPHRGSKCMEKVGEKRYKIAEHGKTILKWNPSSLTIKLVGITRRMRTLRSGKENIVPRC
jgi:hypothetical protein